MEAGAAHALLPPTPACSSGRWPRPGPPTPCCAATGDRERETLAAASPFLTFAVAVER